MASRLDSYLTGAHGPDQAGRAGQPPRSWATMASDCSTVVTCMADVKGSTRVPPARKTTLSFRQKRRSGCRSAIAIRWRVISCCLTAMAGTTRSSSVRRTRRPIVRPRNPMAASTTASPMLSPRETSDPVSPQPLDLRGGGWLCHGSPGYPPCWPGGQGPGAGYPGCWADGGCAWDAGGGCAWDAGGGSAEDPADGSCDGAADPGCWYCDGSGNPDCWY